MDTIDNITEDELVAALFSAQATGSTPTGALTTRELANKVGRSVQWVRDRLRSLIDEGQVESVLVQVTDIANRKTVVPAYKVRDSDKRSGTDILE